MSLAPSAIDEPVLDYDRLIEDYERSLVDTLRGFSPGVEGLELWVPSEDPLISFSHMLDAAAAAGRRRLAVRFGPTSAGRLDPAAVRAEAGRFGRAQVDARGAGLTAIVEDIAPPARRAPAINAAPAVTAVATPLAAETSAAAARPAGEIPACYRRALASPPAVDSPAALEPGPGYTVAEGRADGARLQLAVTGEHVVRAARFEGANGAVEAGLLAHFCRLIIGLPLLEAAHHGVVRLESALREPGAPSPVRGVVTPRAAHPLFGLPERLIRAALADHRARTVYAETDNRYDPRPTPDWLAASAAERADWIHRCLAPIAAALGLTGFEVTAIEYDVRVVLALPPGVPSAEQQWALLAAERRLRAEVEPRLEVYAEERRDKNKIRRLAVVEG